MPGNSLSIFSTGLVYLSSLLAFRCHADAQTNFMVVRVFAADPDGALPSCTLVSDKDAILYGTTLAGGISNNGTVFCINRDGSGFATLKRFNGFDGANPYAGLVVASDGALF